ncbi:MAG: glucose-6-phosphate isomerase [Acidobacteria bacterium]|nr:glucose-6-phosphate isomerase [Acidobacteriota bacterium]
MKTSYEPAARLLDTLLAERVVERIWARDPGVWGATAGSPDALSIANRLGWLDIGETMTPQLDRMRRLRDEVRSEAFDAVYLIGMGGSSLCGEVLRSVYGTAPGFPGLVVLDTTDEHTLTAVAERMNLERSLFLIASKSGGTVEVAAMERFFWPRMVAARGVSAGHHFIAVTDPETGLEKLAHDRGYREILQNPPDIGGRFSALSLFGLAPAAMIGADVDTLVSAGAAMADGCRQHNHANAGLELGAFIGAAALEGRDKLTVALAPALSSLGLWIEQLVAESTGKHGKGTLPVVDEALGDPDVYGPDRVFVSVSTEFESPDEERLAALAAAGFPVLHLSTRSDALGAEFFRWEFATAVAGAALKINPFDEPNVSEAKEKTKALLAGYGARGALDDRVPSAADTVSSVRTAIQSLRPNDYAAFLSYLPADPAIEATISGIRARLRARHKVASTFGVGPRYLHSTGQYHKGGPNTAVAFVLTADDRTKTDVPDAGYSFSVLKRAQALGDIEALEAHGRRVVRIHVPTAEDAPGAITRLFDEALT